MRGVLRWSTDGQRRVEEGGRTTSISVNYFWMFDPSRPDKGIAEHAEDVTAATAKWPMWSAPLEGMSAFLLTVLKFLSIVEPLGSVALLLGVLTRWAAAGLGIIMVGAIVYTRVTLNTNLFTSPQGTGLDYNLLILAGCIVLVAFGAGGWSVDAIRKKDSAVATGAT